MSANITTGLDTIETELGKLTTSSGAPVQADEVTVTDAASVITDYRAAIGELTEVVSLTGKVTAGFLAAATLLANIRATLILAASGTPDWAGNSGVYRALVSKVYDALATDKSGRASLARGVQNQMTRSVLELAIITHTIASDAKFADGKHLTAKGEPTAAFKLAVKAQYDGQGTIASGTRKGEPRLKCPALYGGPAPDPDTTPDADGIESRTVKLNRLLDMATSVKDGDAEFAPLTRVTALHRLVTDTTAWAIAHPAAEGYADLTECRETISAIAELVQLMSDMFAIGAVPTPDVQSAFEANRWNKS